MTERILILGAGVYQLPLIQTANNLGLETHVASIAGPYPGIDSADVFHEIDTTDTGGILALAKNIEIDAILTTGSDICMSTIGKVVDELHLPGTGYLAAMTAMDKSIMKNIFSKYKVPSAQFELVDNIDDAIKVFNQINKPCAIKAVDSSASRGITKVSKPSEIPKAFANARLVSNSKWILVEEWLEGEEYGAQAIVENSEVKLVIIHSDEVTPPPRAIPVGHGAPHINESQIYDSTVDAIILAIKAMKIDQCIANVDLIWTKEGPHIIEIGARMGGTCLPEICGGWWGVNLYEIAINLALGKPIDISNLPQGVPTAAHLLWSDKDGSLDTLPMMSEDCHWVIDVDNGDNVLAFTSGNLRIGHVIGSGSTIVEVEKKVYTYARAFNNDVRLR